MNVISRPALEAFWSDAKSPPSAEAALKAWYKTVSAAQWRNFAELRAQFRSTDKVGRCYVFDIANNDVRLVVTITFARDDANGTVFVKRVMAHSEYDKNTWPDECGCHKPPPKKAGPRPVRGTRGKGKRKP